MRVLLTGGRGLLGRPLARRLAAAHDVTALGRAELDVTRPGDVAAALAEHRPDRVAHLAAWTDVDGCELDPARAEAVNSAGTRNVAQACARARVPLLYVSTDYVFDGRKSAPYDEDDAPNPISVYGRTKLGGEQAVREQGESWWIVRCQSIYGAGRKSFVDAVVARARAGEPLRVVTDQRVSPSWAEDLASALAAVLERAPHGVYHAANEGSCTWYECARAALEVAGLGRAEIEPISAADLGRPAPRPANSAFDTRRLAAATGVGLRHWRAALEKYLGAARAVEEAGR